MNYNHTCIQCSNQFFKYSKHYRLNSYPKFCSKKCRYTISKKQKSICCYCNKEFLFLKSAQPGVFCNKKCEINYRKDPNVRFDIAKKYFESHVIKHKNECWKWTGPLRKGYGGMSFMGKGIGAHKFSWILYKGEVPKEYFVCHHCDTPTCTNPDHLFLGTPKDNMNDMHKKGRNKNPKGSNSPNAKLTEYKVQEIKRMLKKGKTPQEVVELFNISLPSIYDIKDGRTWRHVKI